MKRLADYDDICAAITAKEPFAFSRWGDGEWSCILGKEGTNVDGHHYYPSLGLALAEVLREKPNYLLGMQTKAMKDLGGDITKWLGNFGDDLGVLRWIDADIIHNASIEGRMGKLFDAIKSRRTRPGVVLVGPHYIRKMCDHIGDDIWIVEVPPVNAWTRRNRIELQLDEDDGTLVLFCAGMMSKVLIDMMWRRNKNLTLVDIGSAFDPYCGVMSRKYHYDVMKRLQGENK